MIEHLTLPQDTYERLMNEASDSRRKRSLQAINDTCRLLHERNSSDFTYKTIITLGQDRGLPMPGEKSIVNATGEHYRELIQAWKLASRPKTSEKTDSNDWIEHIEDPVVELHLKLTHFPPRIASKIDPRITLPSRPLSGGFRSDKRGIIECNSTLAPS